MAPEIMSRAPALGDTHRRRSECLHQHPALTRREATRITRERSGPDALATVVGDRVAGRLDRGRPAYLRFGWDVQEPDLRVLRIGGFHTIEDDETLLLTAEVKELACHFLRLPGPVGPRKVCRRIRGDSVFVKISSDVPALHRESVRVDVAQHSPIIFVVLGAAHLLAGMVNRDDVVNQRAARIIAVVVVPGPAGAVHEMSATRNQEVAFVVARVGCVGRTGTEKRPGRIWIIPGTPHVHVSGSTEQMGLRESHLARATGFLALGHERNPRPHVIGRSA